MSWRIVKVVNIETWCEGGYSVSEREKGFLKDIFFLYGSLTWAANRSERKEELERFNSYAIVFGIILVQAQQLLQ